MRPIRSLPSTRQCHRLILARSRGVGVNSRLHGAPVVTGGDQDRIDSVEDALVMGRSAIGICFREKSGFFDALAETRLDVANHDFGDS
jgi:hypothetical protein